MGKNSGWFSIVKKALSPESKKDQKTPKSRKKWFGKAKASGPVFVPEATEVTAEDIKLKETENEQSKHAYSVALATAAAAEAAVAAAQAAAEVVRLASQRRHQGKSNEEIAAIKIQAAFRGYLARRALRALRGLVRLKSLMRGQSVKQQATTTLKCMQTLARLQSEICARRIRMSEENQSLQQKCETELEKLRASMGEDWNDSTLSKEQIEARQQKQQEATMKRERALAYAYCHQQSWKNRSRSVNQTFMDPKNPQWGWSWLERWMAAQPWESRSQFDNIDCGSIKSSVGEISRAYSLRYINQDKKPSPILKLSRLPSCQSGSAPPSKAPSVSSVSSKTRLPSPRGGYEDSRSILSAHSYRYRRHTIVGSSMRHDESLTSSPAVPSYMAPTQSTKARSLVSSPLGTSTPDRGLGGSAKKRLSFPAPQASNRRHSDPPKVDITLSKMTQHAERR